MKGSDHQPVQSGRAVVGRTLALFAAIGWVYWPMIERLARRWSQDPQYTHGYVGPLFAIIVLWFRRDSFPWSSQPSWWGVPLVLTGALLRLAGSFWSYEWLEA